MENCHGQGKMSKSQEYKHKMAAGMRKGIQHWIALSG
jgi:hypothetical protein